LHDEIGQVLTAIKVELAVAERRIELSGGHAELLDQVQTIADGALQSVRNLSHLLRPSLLDDVGLPAAVDWYLRTFAKRFAISTSLAQKDMSDRLGPEVELAAYRIVQEALTNVARHAMARSCSVMLQRTADSLRVAIEDNGCGFDPAITELSGRRGLGLLGMRERAAQLKGTMRVVSALGEGTRIEVDLPVSAALTLHDELVAAPVHG
jgi:signal transduction histidine kinase